MWLNPATSRIFQTTRLCWGSPAFLCSSGSPDLDKFLGYPPYNTIFYIFLNSQKETMYSKNLMRSYKSVLENHVWLINFKADNKNRAILFFTYYKHKLYTLYFSCRALCTKQGLTPRSVGTAEDVPPPSFHCFLAHSFVLHPMLRCCEKS